MGFFRDGCMLAGVIIAACIIMAAVVTGVIFGAAYLEGYRFDSKEMTDVVNVSNITPASGFTTSGFVSSDGKGYRGSALASNLGGWVKVGHKYTVRYVCSANDGTRLVVDCAEILPVVPTPIPTPTINENVFKCNRSSGECT